jgi:mannosyl-3-phosphoglycerate phosphatase
MKVVFTDLDGTLLDSETYSFRAALPALKHLKRNNVPWIMVTSKTRAEVEYWRTVLDNDHPFIVENGGAAFVPSGYFPIEASGTTRDGYAVLEWGMKHERLIAALDAASVSSQCAVAAFHHMTVQQVAAACDLPIEQAALAKMREYDEPFQILDMSRSEQLLAAIADQGLCWTRGTRFWHITGANDKAEAVRAIAGLYDQTHGSVKTIGLGDGPNDVSFLQTVHIAIVIPSAVSSELMQLLPKAILARFPGPMGWNEAVLQNVAHN